MGLLLLSAVGLAAAEPATVRDLGIPVRGVNWGRLHAGATADGKPSILVSFGQNNGGFFVAEVDFATGWRLRALTLPGGGSRRWTEVGR